MRCCSSGWAIFTKPSGKMPFGPPKSWALYSLEANNGGAHEELAGFPHHSLDTYLPKLVRAGERVAICDQLEDPAAAKGIVKRGVTELVTPGVSFNDNVLDVRRNNYLAAVHFGKEGSDGPFVAGYIDG